jgi:hypothetical protein
MFSDIGAAIRTRTLSLWGEKELGQLNRVNSVTGWERAIPLGTGTLVLFSINDFSYANLSDCFPTNAFVFLIL